ncbi:hypothetical protein EUGRSUZ_C00909 [Eucalyptus grandis]|uniref:Uncharacterized protein n=2 Tax=Eucalyptus grandis TaxID=71139 RepID=A0ACC3LBM6_EUCGR|nr:hypothetical protein EUGRSUZ_C00909 [Eucalyptus grandis]
MGISKHLTHFSCLSHLIIVFSFMGYLSDDNIFLLLLFLEKQEFGEMSQTGWINSRTNPIPDQVFLGHSKLI